MNIFTTFAKYRKIAHPLPIIVATFGGLILLASLTAPLMTQAVSANATNVSASASMLKVASVPATGKLVVADVNDIGNVRGDANHCVDKTAWQKLYASQRSSMAGREQDVPAMVVAYLEYNNYTVGCPEFAKDYASLINKAHNDRKWPVAVAILNFTHTTFPNVFSQQMALSDIKSLAAQIERQACGRDIC